MDNTIRRYGTLLNPSIIIQSPFYSKMFVGGLSWDTTDGNGQSPPLYGPCELTPAGI